MSTVTTLKSSVKHIITLTDDFSHCHLSYTPRLVLCPDYSVNKIFFLCYWIVKKMWQPDALWPIQICSGFSLPGFKWSGKRLSCFYQISQNAYPHCTCEKTGTACTCPKVMAAVGTTWLPLKMGWFAKHDHPTVTALKWRFSWLFHFFLLYLSVLCLLHKPWQAF